MRTLPFVLTAVLLLPACRSGALLRIERRVDRLADSVREKLGPDRLVERWSRRLDHAAHIAPEVLVGDDPRQLGRSTERAVAGVADEIARGPGEMADSATALLDDTVGRLHHLADPPTTWHTLAPDRAVRRLRHVAEDWPRLLLLDKPVMPHRDDRAYRTDPTDDRPEASWLERILERLGI